MPVLLAGATSGVTTVQATDAVTATITLPSATDTLVGKATTDTLTNKTLTLPVVGTTIGVGGATPSASGAGITFPATQSASTNANTLDDYEEGTWTPLVYPAGGTAFTYTTTGAYTKIGRLVIATANIIFTSTNGNTFVAVGDLPFSAASGAVMNVFGTNNTTAVSLAGFVANTLTIGYTKYDGTYYQANGANHTVTIVYFV